MQYVPIGTGAVGSVFPAGFGSNFRIMVGSASGPGRTFKAFLGSARVRVPLSNKIRFRVGSVQHIYGSLRVRIFGPVKTSTPALTAPPTGRDSDCIFNNNKLSPATCSSCCSIFLFVFCSNSLGVSIYFFFFFCLGGGRNYRN